MSAVRKLREIRRLTQQELATRAGLRQQYISDLETGRIRSPTLRAAMKLAAVLKVNPADLLASESVEVAEDATQAVA